MAGDIQGREFRLDPPSLIRWHTLFQQQVRPLLIPYPARLAYGPPRVPDWSVLLPCAVRKLLKCRGKHAHHFQA